MVGCIDIVKVENVNIYIIIKQEDQQRCESSEDMQVINHKSQVN